MCVCMCVSVCVRWVVGHLQLQAVCVRPNGKVLFSLSSQGPRQCVVDTSSLSHWEHSSMANTHTHTHTQRHAQKIPLSAQFVNLCGSMYTI